MYHTISIVNGITIANVGIIVVSCGNLTKERIREEESTESEELIGKIPDSNVTIVATGNNFVVTEPKTGYGASVTNEGSHATILFADPNL